MTDAKDPIDPKGLIRESFRIEGISDAECRSILVDWALSVEGADLRAHIAALLDRYGDAPADHPMRAVLTEGLQAPAQPKRRGGRSARVTES